MAYDYFTLKNIQGGQSFSEYSQKNENIQIFKYSVNVELATRICLLNELGYAKARFSIFENKDAVTAQLVSGFVSSTQINLN